MTLRVTHYGEPVLRQPGQAVAAFDEELADLAEQMLETMYEEEGIGLAAQQIGRALMLTVIDLQLPDGEGDFTYTFDGRTPPLSLIMPLVLANPVVEALPSPEARAEEGCLSFPGIRGDVVRTDRVRVRFQDLEGSHHEVEADGLFGRVIQHEVDHLNGVLFIDEGRMPTNVRRELEPKIRKLKKRTRAVEA